MTQLGSCTFGSWTKGGPAGYSNQVQIQQQHLQQQGGALYAPPTGGETVVPGLGRTRRPQGARPMNAGLPPVVMPQAVTTAPAGEPGCIRKKLASGNR